MAVKAKGPKKTIKALGLEKENRSGAHSDHHHGRAIVEYGVEPDNSDSNVDDK